MSFSYSAVGTREEVAGQLKATTITTGDDGFNQVAAELRDLLVTHFEIEAADPGGDYEYRYTVAASGHGGGNSPLSLQLEVTPRWVRKIAAAPAEPDAGRDPEPALEH